MSPARRIVIDPTREREDTCENSRKASSVGDISSPAAPPGPCLRGSCGGKQRAIDLAVGITGSASRKTNADGIMYSAASASESPAMCRHNPGSSIDHTVCHQSPVARRKFRECDHGFADARMPGQHRLDFLEFHPETRILT